MADLLSNRPFCSDADDKIALVGYYEFVAQHFQKVSNRPKMSKKVQKRHSGAKAPLLETRAI